MLDQPVIIKQLSDWIINFLEKPNVTLNNWPPCPYARQARIYNKIEIIFTEASGIESAVNESLSVFDKMEIAVICFDHKDIAPAILQELAIRLNKELMPKDFVILEDHPDIVENINGVHMNFGPCGLILVAPLSILNAASDKIASTGYYDTWTQSDIDDIVTWRK